MNLGYEVNAGLDRPIGLQEYDMDCTVRALANASGIGYPAAYIIMEEFGRKPGEPHPMVPGLQKFADYGFGTFTEVAMLEQIDSFGSIQRFRQWAPSVAQFIQKYPQGRFILGIRFPFNYHGVALVDGVLMDHYPFERVKRYPWYQVSVAYQIHVK